MAALHTRPTTRHLVFPARPDRYKTKTCAAGGRRRPGWWYTYGTPRRAASSEEPNVISLDGRRLSTADIASASSGAAVEVMAVARERAAESHDFATRASAERPVYGRTTGVGANRSEAVPDNGAHALALLRSHATSAGPGRSAERVRATL